jgi:hypothetical protein
VSQKDFLGPQDFFISINSNLIVKSKFISMLNYPSGSFSYEGRLEGPVRGHITFSKYKDRTAGLILLDDGSKYMIDQLGPDIFTISLSNESAFTQREKGADFIEVTGQSEDNARIAGASICDVGSTCDGPSVIDIMVVYTQQAENSWGGTANTVANITQAVTNMNTSMWSSGIDNVTFRLVHTAKVSYTESGNFSTDLTRLSGNGDGYMDNVHALRDQYGADLVSLIIGSPTSSCGIGYLNTSTTSYSSANAFNVSLYSCVVGNFTMAHECGHNMGLRHDWYADASTSPCSHQHGYVNEAAIVQGTSSPSSSRWRTIMAYNDRCAVAGFTCTRMNFWSNPNMSYNGDVMGSAIGNADPSDEAYAYHRMACLVSAFRSEASAGCSAPFGLIASFITTSDATLSWSAVSDAISYDIDYKLATSSTWINAMSNTPSLAIGISGLASSTLYDWRVRANCTGLSSSYSSSQFTTSASSTCPGPNDVSSNGTIAGAPAISLNTDIKGTISPRNDIDHYRFTVNVGGTITVSLTTLPANYNLAVLNASGTQLAVSQNNGTQSETINLNLAAGNYFAKVFPKGNVNNAASCYTLKVQTGTASDLIVNNQFTLNLFPNPADNQLNLWIEGVDKRAQIKIYDIMGKLVMQQISVNTLTQMNISKLSSGIYMVHVNDGKETKAVKFVKK